MSELDKSDNEFPYVNFDDACKMVNLTPREVRRLIKAGKFPPMVTSSSLDMLPYPVLISLRRVLQSVKAGWLRVSDDADSDSIDRLFSDIRVLEFHADWLESMCDLADVELAGADSR